MILKNYLKMKEFFILKLIHLVHLFIFIVMTVRILEINYRTNHVNSNLYLDLMRSIKTSFNASYSSNTDLY